jgi:hypothetical protein
MDARIVEPEKQLEGHLASTSAALLAIGNFAARLTACEKT